MVQATKMTARFLAMVFFGLMISSCGMFNRSQEVPSPDAAAEVRSRAAESQMLKAETVKKEQTIKALEDKIEVLEQKICILESQVAEQKRKVYAVEHSDPSGLYQKARNLLLENKPDDAAELFSAFAKEHPQHRLADNALYWLGECYYTKGKYTNAIQVFKQLVAAYPKAEKVPDALLKTGYAYLSIDDINRASYFLKQVIKKYPFSPAAGKAEEKLTRFE